jgi:hypothetical protein
MAWCSVKGSTGTTSPLPYRFTTNLADAQGIFAHPVEVTGTNRKKKSFVLKLEEE